MRTIAIDNELQLQEGLELYHAKYTILLNLACATGLRISDILRLTPRDVKGEYLNVIEQKTGKRRSCFLPPHLRDKIRLYVKDNGLRADDCLIPSTNVRRDKALSRTQAYRVFRQVATLQGIDGVISPHSCRKLFARALYAKTKDIYAVQKALNHKYIGDTLIYLTDIGSINN